MYDSCTPSLYVLPRLHIQPLANQNQSTKTLPLSTMRMHSVDTQATDCGTPHTLYKSQPITSPKQKQVANPVWIQSHPFPTLEYETQNRKKGSRRGTLNAQAKNILKAWMFSPEHFIHPYPNEEEKEELATEAGIDVKQLSNWFTNARKRIWQPVLRQYGVEVKQFLSTGRGGPRNNFSKVELSSALIPKVRSDHDAAFYAVFEGEKGRDRGKDRKRSMIEVDLGNDCKKGKTTSDWECMETVGSELDGSVIQAPATIEMEACHSLNSSDFDQSEILAACSLLGLQEYLHPIGMHENI